MIGHELREAVEVIKFLRKQGIDDSIIVDSLIAAVECQTIEQGAEYMFKAVTKNKKQ
ncbi:hypothetical protein [Tuberibacillus calidus]|uniref:hypothetical protein n=1 Tax=Tuberibacillus calidus TaxID=340097 RepID=UPI0004153B92|nr:hypothetical protein [Tuberibacillus calidus]